MHFQSLHAITKSLKNLVGFRTAMSDLQNDIAVKNSPNYSSSFNYFIYQSGLLFLHCSIYLIYLQRARRIPYLDIPISDQMFVFPIHSRHPYFFSSSIYQKFDWEDRLLLLVIFNSVQSQTTHDDNREHGILSGEKTTVSRAWSERE